MNQAEIITLSVVALMMAISPGADFALVTRNSLSYSRSTGLYTTLGITFGTLIHTSYCIAGLAVVINTSPTLFTIIKYIGALYLIFIGVSSFKKSDILDKKALNDSVLIKPSAAFISGFLSNILNPKTTLFFLGIYTQLVTIDTQLVLQLIYGFIISLAHLLWFSSLSCLLTQQKLSSRLKNYQTVINRSMGLVLIALGLKLVLF